MQAKVNEQEAAINGLRAELNEAKLQADLFKGRHEDFNGLKTSWMKSRPSLPSAFRSLNGTLTVWSPRCPAAVPQPQKPATKMTISRQPAG